MKKIISIIIILLIVSVNGIYITTVYKEEIYTDKCDGIRNDTVKTYQNLKFAKRSVAALSGWRDTPDDTNLEIQNTQIIEGSVIYRIAGANRVYINLYSKEGTFSSVDVYNPDRYLLGFRAYHNYPESYKTYFRKQTSQLFLQTQTQNYQYKLDPITLDQQFVPYQGSLDSLEYYGINVEVSENGKEYKRLPIGLPYVTPFSKDLMENLCYYEEYDVEIPKGTEYIRVSMNQSIKTYSENGVSNAIPKGINLAKVEFVGNQLILGNEQTENSSSSNASSSSSISSSASSSSSQSTTSSENISSSLNSEFSLSIPFSETIWPPSTSIIPPIMPNFNVEDSSELEENKPPVDDHSDVKIQNSSSMHPPNILVQSENIVIDDTPLQTIKLNYVRKDRRKSYILNTYNSIMMMFLILTLTIESLMATQFKKRR